MKSKEMQADKTLYPKHVVKGLGMLRKNWQNVGL